MNKKLIFGVLILFLLVQFASATTTKINIKTLPNHEVRLVILDPSGAEVKESFENNSDRYGEVSFTSTIGVDNFKVTVYVKNLRGEKIASESYDDEFNVGDELSFEIATEGYVFLEKRETDETPVMETVEANETEVLEENATEVVEGDDTLVEVVLPEDEGNNFFTNFVISTKDKIISWTTLYIIGGMLLLLTIILTTTRIIKRRSKGKEIVVRKLSEMQQDKREEKGQELEDLEGRLKSIQEQISNLKNKDSQKKVELDQKIENTKRRIEQNRAELERLHRMREGN